MLRSIGRLSVSMITPNAMSSNPLSIIISFMYFWIALKWLKKELMVRDVIINGIARPRE